MHLDPRFPNPTAGDFGERGERVPHERCNGGTAAQGNINHQSPWDINRRPSDCIITEARRRLLCTGGPHQPNTTCLLRWSPRRRKAARSSTKRNPRGLFER